MGLGRNLSCAPQRHTSMRAESRNDRKAQESNLASTVYIIRTSCSAALHGPRLRSAVESGSPRPARVGAMESNGARPIAGSTRMDRRLDVRRSESLDGDLFERRRQQSLNVGQ